MKNISIMIKPASSACNMKCTYCFYKDVSDNREIGNYGLMSYKTAEKILDNIFINLNYGDNVTFSFQGGEPTLAGIDFYKYFIGYCDKYKKNGINIFYTLQTNGYVINEEWCKLLHDNDFLVGLSLDGPVDIHNFQRFDSENHGTYKKIMSVKSMMDSMGVKYNIITVLSSHLARYPNKACKFVTENNIKYIQFIPCLAPLDGTNSKFALTAQRYSSFYSAIFDLWFEQYIKGNYISIKLFDDIVNLIAFGQCNACGLTGKCYPQIIVESDGSVYPCDFFVIDKFKTGNLIKDNLKDIFNSDIKEQFIKREKPKNPNCEKCKYKLICGGGCPRMFKEVFFDKKTGCCGHEKFLEYSIERLIYIANRIK